ncbi:MAG: hypothetical protein ACEPOW_12770 [Bacteroidales bacterium]
MILRLKTERLPNNFYYLGFVLLIVGVWRIFVYDWKGIVLFLISLPCIFLHSGIIIDTITLKFKRYTGMFFIRSGEWQKIETEMRFEIRETSETQYMHVSSITRADRAEVSKLILILNDQEIVLYSGSRKKAIQRMNELKDALGHG